MTWLLLAFDDYTLGAVIDDARVRSLDNGADFLLVTPRSDQWGDEGLGGEKYLHTLDERLESLRSERVAIDHEWVSGVNLVDEIIDVGRAHEIDGLIIAHHNPDDAFPDPEAFDDRLRAEFGVTLDIISVE